MRLRIGVITLETSPQWLGHSQQILNGVDTERFGCTLVYHTPRVKLMRVAVAEWLAGDHDQAMASILLWGRIVKNKVDLDF